MKKSITKNIAFTALFVALCVLLPYAFHSIPGGGLIFTPMHFPVYLCGLICGPQYAVICAIVGPIISSLVTGMPTFAVLPSMLAECLCYGLISALCFKFIKTKHFFFDIYLSLLIAMAVGKIAGGATNALIAQTGNYSISLWATTSLLKALPGIILQLALIPLIIKLLAKIKLIPSRYSGNKKAPEKIEGR